MSRDKVINTVVLTSRENFVWTSMQEIIPSLEKVWRDSSSSNKHSVTTFIVEDTPLPKLMPSLMKADNIVFTCFTLRLAKLAKLIRSTLSIHSRFIIHLHSLATVGCWPINRWDMGDVLLSTDIFISTCKRDRECLKLTYSDAHCNVIPFSLLDIGAGEVSPQKKTKATELCYVGRISAQKNIHTLLYAIHLLLKNSELENFHLKIFGGEDNLGSPNMELYKDGYLAYLAELIELLGLSDHVKIMGFVDRTILRRDYLSHPHILISSSLHSDENFGISALRSLSAGNAAVLSDWGGHSDYPENFHHQVELVSVNSTLAGPVINPHDFAQSIANAIKKFDGHVSPDTTFYDSDVISSQLRSLALTPQATQSSALIPSTLAGRILKNRELYLEENLSTESDVLERRIGCKIFDGYSDDLCTPFLESYGMSQRVKLNGLTSAKIVPWVSLNDDVFEVIDFHRGDRSLPLERGEFSLINFKGEVVSVSKDLFINMMELGYAF